MNSAAVRLPFPVLVLLPQPPLASECGLRAAASATAETLVETGAAAAAAVVTTATAAAAVMGTQATAARERERKERGSSPLSPLTAHYCPIIML